MFELKKGDPLKLEGRVLVYAHDLKPHCKRCPEYPALFSTINPLDEQSFGDEFDPEARAMLEQFLEEARKREHDEHKKIIPVISKVTSIALPHDYSSIAGDVLFAGDILGLQMAAFAMFGLTHAYIMNYVTQQEKALGLDRFLGGVQESFKTYSGKEFQLKVYSLLSELLDGLEGDREKEHGAVQKLRAFVKGSPFLPDVVNMIGLAKTQLPEKMEILSLYVEKMAAIHVNNLHEARVLQGKINSFFKGGMP